MTTLHTLLSQVADLLSTTETYVVGGAVRDRLLKRPLTDLDVVLPTDPTTFSKVVAERLGGSQFPLDTERGVVRVAFPKSLHIDFAKRQGNSWTEDLNRRDFTINALAVPLSKWLTPTWKKHLLDLFQGLSDLKRKQIAAVSPTVFKEDPLRLLRAFRIAGDLGFTISPRTLRLINKEKKLIKNAAPERIREEMLQIFTSNHCTPTFKAMEKIGLLETLLPEIKIMRRTAHVYYGPGGVLRHTLEALSYFEEILNTLDTKFPETHSKIEAYLKEPIGGHPRYTHLKWAVLLHDIGKPATAKRLEGRLRFFEHEHTGAQAVAAMALRFRWSGQETDSYVRLVRNHMRPGNLAAQSLITDKALHRFFHDLGEDAVGLLLVSLGDHLANLLSQKKRGGNTSHEKLTRRMINAYYLKREKVLPPKILTGFDVMKAFHLEPSPLVGQLLEEVKDAQAEGTVKTKDDALHYLRAKVKEPPPENPASSQHA
ncbi:MAG: HD domain-containing protein [Elusimicrobia bacterium]|nr:HD domain-containing protein [Candidatus Obscuribacterium magneticum]